MAKIFALHSNFGNVPIPVLILCKDLFLFVSVFLSVHVQLSAEGGGTLALE